VAIGEPKVARDILMDRLSTKPKKLYGPMNGIFNGSPSIFTSNGQLWHSRRKGMSPAFSSKHVRRMNAVSAQKVDEWIKTRLMTFIENDQAFDIGNEMIMLALDTIIETGFEYEASDKEKEDFVSNLEIALKEFVLKSAINPFRKAFGLFFAERYQAHRATQGIETFSTKIVNAYRQSKNPTKDTIIDRIMNNDAYENDHQRAADITTLLIGGHDTTAFTTSFILRELARHPKEQSQLRESLNSLNREEWRQSEILRKIVKEGMRLFPVAAQGSFRTLGRDFVTDDGLFLPKGSIALIPVILAVRNSNIFEDADSFCPSRWDNPTKEMEEGFMPFATGKQNCIGQSLAMTILNSLVPRICSEFELELIDEGQEEFFLTWKPKNTMIKAKKIS